MITIDANTQEITDMLSRLSGRLTDMRPAMLEISGIMSDASERAFQTESNPATGEPWAELSPFTVALRGSAHPILQVSGQLAASIQADYGSDFAQVGTNKNYAELHQFGGVTGPDAILPGRNVPARPFLGLSDEDETDILEVLAHYIDQSI